MTTKTRTRPSASALDIRFEDMNDYPGIELGKTLVELRTGEIVPLDSLPWYRRDRHGWPIERIRGRPLTSFMRLLCQNIRKLLPLAILSLLTGCAGIPFLQPATDPNVASANAASSSAQTYRDALHKLVGGNPMAGNDQKAADKYLSEVLPVDLKTLAGAITMYQQNPQGGIQNLMEKLQKVKADRDLAAIHVDGAVERTRADTFAPPMVLQPVPQADPNVLAALNEIRLLLERNNGLLARHLRGTNVPPLPIPQTTNAPANP